MLPPGEYDRRYGQDVIVSERCRLLPNCLSYLFNFNISLMLTLHRSCVFYPFRHKQSNCFTKSVHGHDVTGMPQSGQQLVAQWCVLYSEKQA